MNSSQKAAALALINLTAEEDTSYDESEKIEGEGMENGEDSVESDFPPSRYTRKRCCVIIKSEDNNVVATRCKANRSHVHKSTPVSKKKKKMAVCFILRLTTSYAWRWWAKLFYAIFPCKNFLQSCLFGVLGQQTVVYLTLTFSLSLLDDAKTEDGLCGQIFFENPLFCCTFPYAVPTVCAHKRST